MMKHLFPLAVLTLLAGCGAPPAHSPRTFAANRTSLTPPGGGEGAGRLIPEGHQNVLRLYLQEVHREITLSSADPNSRMFPEGPVGIPQSWTMNLVDLANEQRYLNGGPFE